MKNKSSSGGGMPFLGVLQLIFLVLKLVGVISWSWWVVLIPTWIDIALIGIAIAYLLICHHIDNTKRMEK